MIYLIIAIVSMSCFMLDLKFLNIKGINVPQAIMTNYALALALAVLPNLGGLSWEGFQGIFDNDWWYRGIIAGIFYFVSMDMMAASTRLAGVAVTTISARASLIVPIVWAFVLYGEPVTLWQWVGIALVIAALVIIFYRKPDKTVISKDSKGNLAAVLMPLGVFLTLGVISLSMKSSQHIIGQTGDYAADYPLFMIILFASALAGAVIYYSLRIGKQAFRFSWKSVAGGLVLGTCNHLITLGIMHGLRTLPTSVFYALYNIGVVVIITIVGIIVFREKLGWMKTAGICLAVAAIAILSFLG